MHVFDVLGDPVRRRILERLGRGEASSGEVVEAVQADFSITQAAVSQHLKVLRDTGFARVRPEGTRRIYILERGALAEAKAWLGQFGREAPNTAVVEWSRPETASSGAVNPFVDRLAEGSVREQGATLAEMSALAEEPVDWAAQVWDAVLDIATNPADENCAAAGRLLCLLAKDGQEARMARDLDKVFALVKDDRLTVARTVLREFWRVGLVSEALRHTVVDRLQVWFHSCTSGKSGIQIRFDIIDGLAKLHRATGDPFVSQVTSTIVSNSAVPRVSIGAE